MLLKVLTKVLLSPYLSLTDFQNTILTTEMYLFSFNQNPVF